MTDFKKYTLLVADDETMLRDTIVFDFKRKGFNVFSAENGTQALEVVKNNPIDLVISDIRMPGGDGITLLEEIKKFHPHIPVVIFISGFSDLSPEECIAKGAQTVVSKPFERKALMASVLKALGIES